VPYCAIEAAWPVILASLLPCDVPQTYTEFSQLSHIEVGGTKGKVLTTSVQQVHADFQTAVNSIRIAALDVMDVDSHNFDSEFYKWRVAVKVRVLLAQRCATLRIMPRC
jgi:hypothetical protein